MKIVAELLEDVSTKEGKCGWANTAVTVLGFVADGDYTYAIVAYVDQPMFEVEISKLRYIN